MIGPGDEGNPENMQVTETYVATKMSGSHYLSGEVFICQMFWLMGKWKKSPETAWMLDRFD